MADVDTLVTYVPVESTSQLLEALFAAGAGALGDYRECAFITRGRGQFRPVGGANPAIGTVGELEHVDEDRIEVMIPVGRRAAVLAALREAHPYEEPAYYVVAAAGTGTALDPAQVGPAHVEPTRRDGGRVDHG